MQGVLQCLGCLMSRPPADPGPNLRTNIRDEYEKIEVMIDSEPAKR